MKIFSRKKTRNPMDYEEIVVKILGLIFYTGAAVAVLAPVVFVFELAKRIFGI